MTACTLKDALRERSLYHRFDNPTCVQWRMIRANGTGIKNFVFSICAYAWTYQDQDQNKTVTVLHVPPVDSPQSAVKVAIAAKARNDSKAH